MKPMTDVILFLFQVQMLIPDCLLFYFIFFYFILFSFCFVFIILCLHRYYNAKLCLFISEFTDSIAPFVHRCYGAGYCDPCMHRCYGAGLLFVYFQLWNGLQYPIPKVWQVVLPYVSVQCGIVHSDVYGLLYCSCHIVVFPAFYFKVFHRCYVASVVLVFMYW